MARILRHAAAEGIRNRIYTIISLVIIVVIIAYIYIPFGSNNTDSSSSGPITNSSSTTVSSDYGTSSESDNTNATDTEDTSQSNTTPDWTTSNTGENTTSSDTAVQGTQPDPMNKANPSIQPIDAGGIATTMRQNSPQGNSEADKLIADATTLLRGGAGSVVAARDKLNDALRSRTISVQQARFVKDKLTELANKDWLFNRIAVPGDTLCEHYKVQPGDQLRIIGDKHKVPYEFLMAINKINDPRSLKAGETIKIVNGPFNAKVYRSTFTLDVYLQNTYVRSFKVGLGVTGSETPTGLWRVAAGGKLIEPEWTDPSGNTYHPTDPDYPLGSRWIALEGLEGAAKGRQGFAIHGTHQPESLGTASSQGCIRLENGNAILVYNMLIPVYSTVEVLD